MRAKPDARTAEIGRQRDGKLIFSITKGVTKDSSPERHAAVAPAEGTRYAAAVRLGVAGLIALADGEGAIGQPHGGVHPARYLLSDPLGDNHISLAGLDATP